MNLHKKLLFFLYIFSFQHYKSNSMVIIPIISVFAACFGIGSAVKGRYDEKHMKKKMKINGFFDNIQNILNKKNEVIITVDDINKKITDNNEKIKKIEKNVNKTNRKITLLKDIIHKSNILLKTKETILEKTIDDSNTDVSDNESEISNDSVNHISYIDQFKFDIEKHKFQKDLENEKIELEELKEEIENYNLNIKEINEENILYESKKNTLLNNTSENMISEFFSNCTSIYLHNNKIELTDDPNHIEQWKKNLNISMGREANEINEEMFDLSIGVIENINKFLLNKFEKPSFFNGTMDFTGSYNSKKEEKLLKIIEKLEKKETLSVTDSLYFLHNVTKYLKKNKKIEEIERILKILNNTEDFKVNENHLHVIFNSQLKTYKAIVKKIKNLQTILILYLICVYAKKNNLSLDKNKQLTSKQSFIENILANDFIKIIPQVVIVTLMNHGKLINGIFEARGLQQLETDNSLLLKIGDNLLNSTEKNINSEDIIKLLFLIINNIESEKTMLTEKDLTGLASIFNSSSLLLTNLSLLT